MNHFREPWERPTRAEANRDEADTLPASLTTAEQEQVAAYFTEYQRLVAQIGAP